MTQVPVDHPVRLLVVDDHEILRNGLKFMLRNQKDLVIVGEAADGAEVVDQIAATTPDVVLLDLNMPTVNGLEALRRIRQRWPDLPVVVFTVHDDPEYVEEALRSGASGYLVKSVDSDELLKALRAVSNGAGYLQAEITRPVLERFARARAAPVMARLSPRERELLELLSDGLANKQIARRLELSESTVKGYLSALFEKLGAADRAHAVALALRSRTIQ